MKKNTIKMILFVVIALIITRAVSIIYMNNPRNTLEYTKFFNVPDDLQIANFGSSHAEKGIDYSDVDLSSFNFALSSQSIQYDKRILSQYIDSFDENAVVIIPLSYFSFYKGDNAYDFDRSNFRYHYFLKPRYIADFSLYEYLLYGVFPVITGGENKFNILIRGDVEDDEYVSENKYTLDELAEIGKSRADTHNKLIKEGKGEDEQIVTNDLYEMIELCHDNNLNVILITTPYTAFYNDSFKDSVYVDFYNHIDEVVDKYNVTYLDYSHDEDFTYNYDLFMDTDHLNDAGSEIFMEVLMNDLKGLGYIE